MKKIILLSVVFLSVQSFGIFRLGFQGGLSSANVTTEPASTTNSRSGFLAGAAVEISLGFDWALLGEAIYVQKGAVTPATALTPETATKFDYFEVPVFIKYTLDFIPVVKPYLFAGPYMAFKLKAESQVTGSSTTTALTGYKSTDVGIGTGLGLEIFLSPVSSIFGSARYDFGLSNIADTTVGGTTKNKGFLFAAGLMFGF